MEREIAAIGVLLSVGLLIRIARTKNTVHLIWGIILSKSIKQSNTEMSTVLINTKRKGVSANMILEFDTRTMSSCKHPEGEECFHNRAAELNKILHEGEQVTITSRKVIGNKEKLVLVFKLVFPYLR